MTAYFALSTELCKKSLEEDDVPEDEIEEELAIVRYASAR